MGRSIIAVVVGLVVIGVLSVGMDEALMAASPAMTEFARRVDGVPVLLVALAYVFATVGCRLTARLAPGRPMQHALVLG